jgi:hypothetical protein
VTDDWPNHMDELTRKTTEQLDKWGRAFNAAKISKREFYIMVSALYDATSGLIHKDVSNLMADIHKELRDAP